MNNPPVVLTQVINKNDTTNGSPEFIFDRLRAYNKYNKYEIAFSCLVIEALISHMCRESVKTRFFNIRMLPTFKDKSTV